MKRWFWTAIAVIAIWPGAASPQSTWPNVPDSYATLLQDANFLGSNLANSINNNTPTVRVTSASLLTVNQEIFVDYEGMLITAISGTTLTVVRGFDNTIPASHAQNARVYRLPGAALHNFALSAIFALEKTPFRIFSDTPTGSCTPNNLMGWVPGGSIYGCVNGTWKAVSGAGSGGGSFTQAFTSQTSVAVPYNLGTNNVLATVYDGTGNIIPGGYAFTLAKDGSNATLQFATPQTGSIIVLSPGAQIYTQSFVSQTTVAVSHGLGTLHPAMSVYNVAGTYLFGQTLSPVDANNSTLAFAAPQSGTVILVRQ